MKTRHLLLAISMTAIWRVNFSAIDPLMLAGIRTARFCHDFQ